MIDVRDKLRRIKKSHRGWGWDDLEGLIVEVAAERDALEAKLAAVLGTLEPGEKPLYTDARMAVWKTVRLLHARAVAIAEGRDDG